MASDINNTTSTSEPAGSKTMRAPRHDNTPFRLAVASLDLTAANVDEYIFGKVKGVSRQWLSGNTLPNVRLWAVIEDLFGTDIEDLFPDVCDNPRYRTWVDIKTKLPSFPAQLQQWLINNDIAEKELAQQIGCCTGTVNAWLTWISMPPEEKYWQKIKEITGISITSLDLIF